MKTLTKNPLTYSHKKGRIVWSVSGKPAGYYVKKDDMRYIKLQGRAYPEHKLVWMLHHGDYPTMPIGWINGDKTDNRIENLFENPYNIKPAVKRDTDIPQSGIRNIHYDRNTDRWRVVIKGTHIGSYESLQEAKYAKASVLNTGQPPKLFKSKHQPNYANSGDDNQLNNSANTQTPTDASAAPIQPARIELSRQGWKPVPT